MFLPDGRVLAAGGTGYYLEPEVPDIPLGVVGARGPEERAHLRPQTNTLEPDRLDDYGRWYPTLVTLANGKVFVASGVTKLLKPVYPDHPLDSGRNVMQTETYDPATGKWSDNGAPAERSLPLFPRLHLLPDGHVYYNAAGQAFNPFGQAYDEALWNTPASYDPARRPGRTSASPGCRRRLPICRRSTSATQSAT